MVPLITAEEYFIWLPVMTPGLFSSGPVNESHFGFPMGLHMEQ